MAQIERFSCDVCGAVKGEANHWYLAWTDIIAENDEGTHRSFELREWQSGDPKHATAQHLCGQQCAHKLLDEFLQKAAKTS